MDTPPQEPNGIPDANDGSGPRPGEESGATDQPVESGQSSNLPSGAGGVFSGPDYQPSGSVPPSGYAYYPRYYPQNKGPIPPAPAVVRFAAIGEAWQLIREDFTNFVVAYLVVIVLGGMVSYIIRLPAQVMIMTNAPNVTPGTFNPFDIFPHTTQFWTIYVASLIVSQTLASVFMAGMYSLCLKRLRGEPYSIANVFDGFKFIGPLAITSFITLIVSMVSFLLFVVPYFFAAGAFAFVPLIIMDQKAPAFEAIALSFASVKKDVFFMGILVFVAGLVSALGVCACLVGIIFTGPIMFMTIALHYHAYFPPQGGPETAPVMPMPIPQYSV